MNAFEYIIYYIKDFFREFPETMKYFFQRIFRGWDDRETWDIEYEFLKWILPRLKRYAKISLTYPRDYTIKGWELFLTQIIKRTEKVIEKYKSMRDLSIEEQEELYKEKTQVAQVLSDHLKDFGW